LVLPPGYQADIRDPIQAQLIIIQLISVLCGYVPGEAQSDLACAPNEAWQLDCCYRVLDLHATAPNTTSGEYDRVLASIARFVCSDLETRCPKRKIGPVVDLIISLLEQFEPQHHPEFASSLESTMHHLLSLCPQNSKHMVHLRRTLLPILQRFIISPELTHKDASAKFLCNVIEILAAPPAAFDTEARPVKRQRLNHAEPDAYEQLRQELVKEVTEQMTGAAQTSLPELDEDAIKWLRVGIDSRQTSVLAAIGLLPCVVTRCLKSGRDGGVRKRCKICDTVPSHEQQHLPTLQSEDSGSQLCQRLLTFLSLCIADSHLQRSKAFRVTAANAIRRISNHINDSECSMLSWKGIGPWLMRSLQSSVRELRIASAEALVSYLREDLSESIRTRNRLDALDFLKFLAEKNNFSDQETLTFAWGLIGRTCGDAELNLALLQLVDYLGHPHSLVSAAAYHEIIQLAGTRGCTPLELLNPYWSNLATHVVKDIFACPQKVQQLADLLGLSVNDLLMHTQTDTIPFLVLTRKKEVLQRIAQARGASIAVQDLWLQPSKNLAAVLALLLIQPSEDPEQSAIALLKDASPTFAEDDLSALVKVDPILIACEILKHAGDCPEAKKPQAYQGLRLLAAINERKSGSGKSSKSSKHLSAFLEAHILGIMSHFTDIIDAPITRQPLAEKKRALRAVEQLVIIGKSQVGIAIPQVRVCYVLQRLCD
jgi:serine/threonine-protein kinase ATR